MALATQRSPVYFLFYIPVSKFFEEIIFIPKYLELEASEVGMQKPASGDPGVRIFDRLSLFLGLTN